jgi:hypothetical protein
MTDKFNGRPWKGLLAGDGLEVFRVSLKDSMFRAYCVPSGGLGSCVVSHAFRRSRLSKVLPFLTPREPSEQRNTLAQKRQLGYLL